MFLVVELITAVPLESKLATHAAGKQKGFMNSWPHTPQYVSKTEDVIIFRNISVLMEGVGVKTSLTGPCRLIHTLPEESL